MYYIHAFFLALGLSHKKENIVRIAYLRPYDGINMDICLGRSLRLIIQRHLGSFGLVG